MWLLTVLFCIRRCHITKGDQIIYLFTIYIRLLRSWTGEEDRGGEDRRWSTSPPPSHCMKFNLWTWIQISRPLLELPWLSRSNLGTKAGVDRALNETLDRILSLIMLCFTKGPRQTNKPHSPSEAAKPPHLLQSEAVNLNKQMSVKGPSHPMGANLHATKNMSQKGAFPGKVSEQNTNNT